MTKTFGIQPHSVGSVFPVIIVGLGSGYFRVQLGSAQSANLTHKEAIARSEYIHKILQHQGYQEAVEAVQLHPLRTWVEHDHVLISFGPEIRSRSFESPAVRDRFHAFIENILTHESLDNILSFFD